jgi:glucose uptake protein
MFIISNYGTAIAFCLVTMLCWGSWANTQKLSKKTWAFQLFYWDYCIGVVALALMGAFTLGSHGTAGRSFLIDLHQATPQAYVHALIGGVVFNIANILLVTSIDIAGMAVAFPIAIGLALALGVIENYFAVPVGNAPTLFAGVLAVVVAIALDALAYKRLQQKKGKGIAKGIIIALVSGVLMGTFYRFVAESMSIHFTHPAAGLFTPYSAMVVFAVGILVSSLLWNTWMMYRPLSGTRVTYGDYFKGKIGTHCIGILGGMIWGAGMLFSVMASGKAGFAISYGLGQGATMIAALWGVFIWKEFKGAHKMTSVLLTWMFVFYVLGLALIILARVA